MSTTLIRMSGYINKSHCLNRWVQTQRIGERLNDQDRHAGVKEFGYSNQILKPLDKFENYLKPAEGQALETRKVCLLGSFGVGKTSLVRRFVHAQFDEAYMSTLGLRIDSKQIRLNNVDVKLMIWDIEGLENLDEDGLMASRIGTYIQGTAGIVLVADGTREHTLQIAKQIYVQYHNEGHRVPAVLLLNKVDRINDWALTEQLSEDQHCGLKCFNTSAMTGENVEQAFRYLAEQMVSRR